MEFLNPAVVGTVVLTALVGGSLGLLGSGGSIVMLPVLVYVAGVVPQDAVPLSLAIVGATSAFGAVLYYKKKNVRLRPVLLFGASGVPGSWLGSALTNQVTPHVLMLIFAGIMLIVGTLMLRRKNVDRKQSHSCYPPRCLLVGAAVGGLTGFLGVGGGFLLVPALIWFAGVDTRSAVGTSLAIIALNSMGGVAGHAGSDAFPWAWAAGLSAVGVLGMLAGLRASLKLRSNSLRTIFAWFVLVIAVSVAAINLSPLLMAP
jgi:uncharacterized membrane protein YfcA